MQWAGVGNVECSTYSWIKIVQILDSCLDLTLMNRSLDTLSNHDIRVGLLGAQVRLGAESSCSIGIARHGEIVQY